MEIKLTPEQVDEVVRKDLKSALEYSLKPESDPHESYENRAYLVDALHEVLQYYSKPSEHYKMFLETSLGLLLLKDHYGPLENAGMLREEPNE